MPSTTRIRNRGVTPILAVSPEIRLYIYHYFFKGIVVSSKCLVPDRQLPNELFRRYHNTDPELLKENFMAVLWVCRLIRTEAQAVMYQHVQVLLSGQLSRYHRPITNEILANLRVMQYNYWPMYRMVYNLSMSPKLETLILNFDYHIYVEDLRTLIGDAVDNSVAPKFNGLGHGRNYQYAMDFIWDLYHDKTRNFRVLCRTVPSHRNRICGRAIIFDIDQNKEVDFEFEAATWRSPHQIA